MMTAAEQQELATLKNKAWIAWGKWSWHKDRDALDRYFEYCERLVRMFPVRPL